MEKQSDSFYFIKIALSAILIYSNVGAIFIIGNVAKIIFTYTYPNFWAFIITDIVMELLKLAILIGLFNYFYKHLEYIVNHKKINQVLLINICIFPVISLINYGLATFQNIVIMKNEGVQLIGEIAQYRSIITIGAVILNIVVLTVLGIMALVKRPDSQNEIPI